MELSCKTFPISFHPPLHILFIFCFYVSSAYFSKIIKVSSLAAARRRTRNTFSSPKPREKKKNLFYMIIKFPFSHSHTSRLEMGFLEITLEKYVIKNCYIFIPLAVLFRLEMEMFQCERMCAM